jgi:hypothetical protein
VPLFGNFEIGILISICQQPDTVILFSSVMCRAIRMPQASFPVEPNSGVAAGGRGEISQLLRFVCALVACGSFFLWAFGVDSRPKKFQGRYALALPVTGSTWMV